MSDYKKYVSFELPEWAENNGVDPDEVAFDDSTRAMVEKALGEISSTPEGFALIEKAAASYPDGKINILFNDGGFTLAISPNDFVLGSEDSDLRYLDDSENSYDVSIQRLVYHELQHIALDHAKIRGDEDIYGISSSKESEAVRETNKFMKKYYNEPPRSEDTSHANFDGTDEWDFNEGFKAEGYADNIQITLEDVREKISQVSAEDMAQMSPEMQALYEFKDRPELFERQWDLLLENESFDFMQADLDGIIAQDSVSVQPEVIQSPVQSALIVAEPVQP